MVHLCTGLRPIPGSRFSRPCRRQVRSALGRCEECRPAPVRRPADPADQRRWNANHRAKSAWQRAGAGIAGVALGFGAQSLVKDVIAGFFMLMENQFGVGDIISVDDKHAGTVERMTLRITQIRDSEGKAHFLPNGTINRVVVLSKEFARALVDVEVAYDTDPEAAMALIRGVGSELAAAWPERVLEPTEVLGVEVLGQSGFTLRSLTKVAPGKQWEVQRELRKRILLAFREAGIEIPFPQRVVRTVS